MLQAKLLVSGQVQGVSYRSFVSHIAGQMKINGKVKNLEDGDVEIVCECKTENGLEKFMKAIKRNDAIMEVKNIRIVEKKEIKDPGFETFFIVH